MKTSRTLTPGLLLDRKVGRVTPCAPEVNNAGTARRGLTRPTDPSPWCALLVYAALITGSSLLCPASAHAQGGVPLWTNLYQGAANGGASPAAIAVDRTGNVFVTGSY